MNKNFLNLRDLPKKDLENIIESSLSLKESSANTELLAGKYIALIFEKSSTRTRVSFEVAMNQLGGKASFLSIADLQLGRGEPLEDTARVIGSMADGVVLRTQKHETQQTFASFSSAATINGLSNLSHPCQVLTDLLTYFEENGSIEGEKVSGLETLIMSVIAMQKLQIFLTLNCTWPVQKNSSPTQKHSPM